MNSMWETVMRQRAWLGYRSAAVAWLVFGVLSGGPAGLDQRGDAGGGWLKRRRGTARLEKPT